jgi:hypothetical protein
MKELKNSEEVKKSMTSTKPIAVFFYMNSCPHCQVMHKPWGDLEKEMKDIEFEKVESEHVPPELGISGFPHFVLIRNGKKKSTGGEMTKDALKSKLFSSAGSRVKRRRTRGLTRRRAKVAHRTSRINISLRK